MMPRGGMGSVHLVVVVASGECNVVTICWFDATMRFGNYIGASSSFEEGRIYSFDALTFPWQFVFSLTVHSAGFSGPETVYSFILHRNHGVILCLCCVVLFSFRSSVWFCAVCF